MSACVRVRVCVCVCVYVCMCVYVCVCFQFFVSIHPTYRLQHRHARASHRDVLGAQDVRVKRVDAVHLCDSLNCIVFDVTI